MTIKVMELTRFRVKCRELDSPRKFAGIAQSVEQRIRNAKVVGSTPIAGTRFTRVGEARQNKQMTVRENTIFIDMCLSISNNRPGPSIIDPARKLSMVKLLLVAALLVQSCASSDTVGGTGTEIGPQQLRVNQGDVVFIVNDRRARLVMRVLDVTGEGLTGVTLESRRTSVNPDVIRFIPFNEIALLQLELDSPDNEMMAVAAITVIGALVMAAQFESALESMTFPGAN
jgi:hypothetical protein